MPRYTLRGVDIAEELYDNLLASTRQLVDRRIEELLEDPTGNPPTQYDEQFDQWSVPIGADEGFILYAVVHEPVQVVTLFRFIPGFG